MAAPGPVNCRFFSNDAGMCWSPQLQVMAVPVVGSLLIFSLLIGPPAAARSFTNSPLIAIGLSVVFALVTVWVAIAVSYETNLPIGFFVGAISAFAYTVGRAWTAWQQTRGRRRHHDGEPGALAGLGGANAVVRRRT